MFTNFIRRLDTAHLSLGVLIYGSGCVAHYFHRLDPEFITFTSTILTFLGAHLWIKGSDNDVQSGQ